MSEREPVELTPGTVFELPDMTLLPYFENGVARAIVPGMSDNERNVWKNRERLAELLKPEDFFGRVIDATFEVMDEPYERMLDAGARGWKFRRGIPHTINGLNNPYCREHKDSYVGLRYSALARSTGRGVVGEIRSELWYFPADLMKWRYTERDFTRFRASHQYKPIIRYVARAVLDESVTNKPETNGRHYTYELGRYELLNPQV